MEDTAFAERVQHLEQRAAAQPTAYKLRVIGLAALGYGYMIGVLIGLVVLAVAMVLTLRLWSVKLVAPLVVVIVAVVRALWVQLPPPQGVPLQEEEAPRLFELVRTLQRRLGAPPVDSILVVPDLNAAVVQLPRLGLLGWYQNYLLVGLPLLQALSDTEWQAVLAHELGHLSGRHGWFGAWIYRTRTTWTTLVPLLEANKSAVGRFLFSGFLKWYAPWFNAYTFVLARAHEFEADAASAEITGSETARRALLRVEVAGHLVGGFWSALEARVTELSEPPEDPFQQLRYTLVSGVAGPPGADRITQAWSRQTRYNDTHPALADRLRALGWTSEANAPPPPPEPLQEPPAASVYLGAAEARLALEYDRQWVGQVKPSWQARHAKVVAARERLNQLDARPEGSLTPEEDWERIAASVTVVDSGRVETLCQALLEREPENAGAHFQRGRALLERGDAGGVAHLEAAMRHDAEATLPCCVVLMQYFQSVGEFVRVEQYRATGMERERLVASAEQERRFMSNEAQLEPHGWSAEQVAALAAQLARFPEIGEAYLARRVVTFLPEHPCFVLCILPRTRWRKLQSGTEATALVKAIARNVECPMPYQVYHLTGKLKAMRERLGRMPGARVL